MSEYWAHYSSICPLLPSLSPYISPTPFSSYSFYPSPPLSLALIAICLCCAFEMFYLHSDANATKTSACLLARRQKCIFARDPFASSGCGSCEILPWPAPLLTDVTWQQTIYATRTQAPRQSLDSQLERPVPDWAPTKVRYRYVATSWYHVRVIKLA